MDTLDKVDFYKIVPELITEMGKLKCDDIKIDVLYDSIVVKILKTIITGFGSTITIIAAKAAISPKKDNIIALISTKKNNIVNKCKFKTYEKNKEIVYIVINSILDKYKDPKYNNSKMSKLLIKWETYKMKYPVNPSGGKHRKTLNRKKTLKRKKSSLYKSRRRL